MYDKELIDAMELAELHGLVVDFYNMRVICGKRLQQGHNDWHYADEDEGDTMAYCITQYAENFCE